MSGHSKWNNIKNTKGVADAKKGKIFAQLSKDISRAVIFGGSPDFKINALLRVAIDKAKSLSLPNEKIDKAINVGAGIKEKDNISEEKTYEAYGVNGVMFLIDCETDNPNRTLGELKIIINKTGGKIVPIGSISWQFKEFVVINIELTNFKNVESNIILPIMNLEGIDDIDNQEKNIYIKTTQPYLRNINQSLKNLFENKILIKEIEFMKIAVDKVELIEKDLEINIKLKETLEEQNDVINIWSNM